MALFGYATDTDLNQLRARILAKLAASTMGRSWRTWIDVLECDIKLVKLKSENSFVELFEDKGAYLVNLKYVW